MFGNSSCISKIFIKFYFILLISKYYETVGNQHDFFSVKFKVKKGIKFKFVVLHVFLI